MTAVDYLNQYKHISETIENQKLLIESLRNVAEKMVGDLKPDKVQSNNNDRLQENTVIEIAEEERWLNHLKRLRFSIGEEIKQNVKRYAPATAGVLLNYYITELTLEAIGHTCGRKTRQWALDTRRKGESEITKAMMTNPDAFTQFEYGRREHV